MKLQNKNTVHEASDEPSDQEAIEFHDTNPICDIMESGNRRQLVPSQKDLETILQLAEVPPRPTPELIAGFKQVRKNLYRRISTWLV